MLPKSLETDLGESFLHDQRFQIRSGVIGSTGRRFVEDRFVEFHFSDAAPYALPYDVVAWRPDPSARN